MPDNKKKTSTKKEKKPAKVAKKERILPKRKAQAKPEPETNDSILPREEEQSFSSGVSSSSTMPGDNSRSHFVVFILIVLVIIGVLFYISQNNTKLFSSGKENPPTTGEYTIEREAHIERPLSTEELRRMRELYLKSSNGQ